MNTWALIGAMPQSRSGAAAAVLADGRMVIAGGRVADGSVTDSVVVFNPLTNEVTSVGRLLEPRVGHTATLLAGGRVLVAGGTVDGLISTDIEVVDLGSGASTLVASLTVPRAGHAATALSNGKILIVGGTTLDDVVLRSAELVDPETLAVTPVAGSLQVPRRDASATTLIDGRVLIVGGSDGAQDLASAEMFEPTTGAFAPLDPESHLSVPRGGHTAVLLPNNNGVLIAGGRSNGMPVANSDVFVPPIFPDPYSFGIGRFAPAAPMGVGRAAAIGGPAGSDGYALVIGGGPLDAEAYRFATIKTGKDDYAPGERAIITGSGWQAGEDVTLIFQEDPAVHEDYVLHVTADSRGDIYWDQWAPEQHDLNVRFYLTALDSKSHAQMTFTDSQPGNVTLTPATVSVAPGANAVAQVRIVQNGNAAACALTLSAAYTGAAASGTAFSFAVPNPVTMTGSDVNTSLTITTTNSGPIAGWTQPGNYPFRVTVTPGPNCQGSGAASTASGTLVVTGTPAAASTLSVAPATGTYGGTVSLSATLAASGLDVSGKTVTFTLNGTSVGSATTSATGVATLTGVSLSGINAGTYASAIAATFAGDLSLLASTGSNSLTINKADATVSVAGFTGVYDGSAHGATGSATGVAGEDLSALLSLGSAFTSVPGGVANWTFSGDTNYSTQSGAVNIVISKADAIVSVSGYTGVYDGEAHGATGTATGVNGEDLYALLDLGATFTNVPGGTASWSFTGDTNYNPTTGTASIVISKADANVSVNGYSGVYDGDAHGATGTATGVKGEDVSALLDLGATFTNVPGGTANWSFAGNGNYNPASGTASVVITKADALVSVNGYTGVYDGDAHGATGTATGVKGDDLSALLDLGATFTNVPGGTANWSFAGNSNYNPTSGTASVVISKADALISVNSYSGVYDGDAHGATGTATGVKGEDLYALLDLGATFTNVPGGTVSWSFAGNGNYNPASGTASVTITKADAAITVNGYTGVYDGSAHGATGTAVGVKGENLNGLLDLGASFTNVPGGTANWAFAGNDNYAAASGSAAIVLTKAAQVIAWATPAPIVYGDPLSGTQLNATLTAGDGALTYSPALGAVLAVGQQVLHVSAAATTNYNEASAQVTLVVSPWHLTGFYNPVTMGGISVVNTVKGGSTVPLKFNIYRTLGGVELTSVNDIGAFQVYIIGCSASTAEDAIEFTTSGATSLRYDFTSGQFVQNWQTPKSAGACYKVAMTAKDGTSIVAFFKTK